MKTNDQKLYLSPDEAEYIKNIIIKNEYIIRAAVKSVLRDNYKHIGEDCISEIYFLACRKIETLKDHENPDAWITVAARMVALNEARKFNNYINKHTRDEAVERIATEDHVFEDALYNIWLDNGSIEKLLDLLTDHEREIYDMLYKKGLPPKKTAEIMGLSVSTVRNTNKNIIKKIKTAIKSEKFLK